MKHIKKDIKVSREEMNNLLQIHEANDYYKFAQELINHISEITVIDGVPRQIEFYAQAIREHLKVFGEASNNLIEQTHVVGKILAERENLNQLPSPTVFTTGSLNLLHRKTKNYNEFVEAAAAGKRYYLREHTTLPEYDSSVKFFETPKDIAEYLLENYKLVAKVNQIERG